MLLAGCPADNAPADEPEEMLTPGTTTDGPPLAPTSTGPVDPTESAESSTGNDDNSFLVDPDIPPIGNECDLWTQDCPMGDKCMPWVNDGGSSWNATRCTSLTDNPNQPGDPCTVDGNAGTGIDDCDIGAMCWAVDGETNEGVCVALCEGNPEAPLCSNPDEFCSITNDGVLPLCLPSCDPLLQDCADGQACYWLPADGGFVCVQDVSGELGAAGDPCDGFVLNRCDPGLQCTPAEAVPGCTDATSCCSPFCDLEEPNPGCLAAQECIALFEEGDAPPGTEDYGVCAIPAG